MINKGCKIRLPPFLYYFIGIYPKRKPVKSGFFDFILG
nr:MAG TPA: hypothetical protein [Caudoviricetes sp.]